MGRTDDGGPISFMGKICRNERYLAVAHKMSRVKWLRVHETEGAGERAGKGDEEDGILHSAQCAYSRQFHFGRLEQRLFG